MGGVHKGDGYWPARDTIGLILQLRQTQKDGETAEWAYNRAHRFLSKLFEQLFGTRGTKNTHKIIQFKLTGTKI